MSRTSEAVKLMLADTSDTCLSVKARKAAKTVGLLSHDGVRLAFIHYQNTKDHRCHVCNHLNIG